LSVADSQIVYYKQLSGGQMQVRLARYLDKTLSSSLRNVDVGY